MYSIHGGIAESKRLYFELDDSLGTTMPYILWGPLLVSVLCKIKEGNFSVDPSNFYSGPVQVGTTDVMVFDKQVPFENSL